MVMDMSKSPMGSIACPDGKTTGGPVSPFFGASEANRDLQFAAPAVNFNGGYYVSRADKSMLSAELVNNSNDTKQIYCQTELEYLPENPAGAIEISLQVLEVDQCSEPAQTTSQMLSGCMGKLGGLITGQAPAEAPMMKGMVMIPSNSNSNSIIKSIINNLIHYHFITRHRNPAQEDPISQCQAHTQTPNTNKSTNGSTKSSKNPSTPSSLTLSKKRSFLSLPPEMRQDILLLTYDDKTVRDLAPWRNAQLDYAHIVYAQQFETLVLDHKIFITKWADVLRRAHEAIIEGVDFVEKKWNKGLKELIESMWRDMIRKGQRLLLGK